MRVPRTMGRIERIERIERCQGKKLARNRIENGSDVRR